MLLLFRYAALLGMLLLAATGTAVAQQADLTRVVYAPSDEHFPNPERGFFNYTDRFPGASPHRAEDLRAIRDEGKTLIWSLYTLGAYREKDLPESFFEQLDADFAAMREAGIKCVLRFRYSRSMDEPDAPLEVVLRHLDQLQPVFERNYDVIAVAQAGFIGAWGEWHASTNDLTRLENMRAILFKFMDVLPERAIQIRYPKVKMDIFETSAGLPPEEAFDGSDKSRTGHHNDCFLASSTDVGTYRISRIWEQNYLNKETRYVPMGGETCQVQDGEYYFCDNAIFEMEKMHWSYLNSDYYLGILNHWREEGCMPEIERRLGYRFVLSEGRYTSAVAPGGTFHFELDLENQGFASPYNPRGFQAVLRSTDEPERMYEVNLPSDPRFWAAGERQELKFALGIPTDVPEGNYTLHLFLPDPIEALRHRPEYAIRVANEGVWDEETGMNDLQHMVTINSSAGGAAYEGSDWFVEEEATVVSAEQPAAVPIGAHLSQSWPNPFRDEAHIRFALSEPTFVTLGVYDVMGRQVQRLLSAFRSAGVHEVRFDGRGLAPGKYFYQLTTSEGAMVTRSMTVVR